MKPMERDTPRKLAHDLHEYAKRSAPYDYGSGFTYSEIDQIIEDDVQAISQGREGSVQMQYLVNVLRTMWQEPDLADEADGAEHLLERFADFVDSYRIYQLIDHCDSWDYRNESLDQRRAYGHAVVSFHYELLYMARLPIADTPERIFQRFHAHPPAAFAGRSPSVGDIIVFRRDGQEVAYYLDRFGFQTVPEFLEQENMIRLAAQEDKQQESIKPEPSELSAECNKELKVSICAQLKAVKVAVALLEQPKACKPKEKCGLGCEK